MKNDSDLQIGRAEKEEGGMFRVPNVDNLPAPEVNLEPSQTSNIPFY